MCEITQVIRSQTFTQPMPPQEGTRRGKANNDNQGAQQEQGATTNSSSNSSQQQPATTNSQQQQQQQQQLQNQQQQQQQPTTNNQQPTTTRPRNTQRPKTINNRHAQTRIVYLNLLRGSHQGMGKIQTHKIQSIVQNDSDVSPTTLSEHMCTGMQGPT